MSKEKLSSTSALVLLWTDKSLYSSNAVNRYWTLLDLSSGIDLYDKCNRIWPYYAHVINNRKWLIAKWAKEALFKNLFSQVIIFAAGLAPLGLEIAESFPDCRIYEVDLTNMDLKAQLVGQIENAPKNISFVTSDISQSDITRDNLIYAGWSPDKPSLLIIEGISYYLQRSDLVGLFELGIDGSRAIMEFMVHDQRVNLNRREIPKKVFDTIARDCSLESPIETWDISAIRKEIPGRVERHTTLCDIEMMKYYFDQSHQRVFPSPGSGWIEIVDIHIQRT